MNSRHLQINIADASIKTVLAANSLQWTTKEAPLKPRDSAHLATLITIYPYHGLLRPGTLIWKERRLRRPYKTSHLEEHPKTHRANDRRNDSLFIHDALVIYLYYNYYFYVPSSLSGDSSSGLEGGLCLGSSQRISSPPLVMRPFEPFETVTGS